MSYHLPFFGEYIFPLKEGNSKWKRAKSPHSTLYTNRENLCCQLWLVGTKIFTGIPRLLQLSITNFVPRDVPSQNANTRSAFSIIVMLRFNGADLPYFSYSGRNSVSLMHRYRSLLDPRTRSPSRHSGDISPNWSRLALWILRLPLSHFNTSDTLQNYCRYTVYLIKTFYHMVAIK